MKISRSFWKHLAVVSGLGVGIALSGAGSAQAQTATDTFLVRADVVASCTITAGDMNFGAAVDVMASNTDVTSTIQVVCATGVGIAVTLDDGIPANGVRQLAFGTNRLPYELYSESTRTTRWGNTILTGKGWTAPAADLTVYGRIPMRGPGLGVPPGLYTDTVTATINY